ncbi:MAG: glycan-binding surface protein [Bacteroidales bacterium]|nr:glycan-binding surface protein [Bacteroidales bacterium]
MKSIKTISYLFAATLLVSGLSSCDKADYPNRFRPTEGKPTVHSIRYANTDTQIEQAFMEEVVCLLGENLKSIHDIWFNDQQAILNTSFITDNTLLVQVPKTMPTVETDKIYLVTAAKDTLTYDFRVLPPVPRIKEMSFEYAADGDEVTIYGNYFYQKPGSDLVVEFPNATCDRIPDSDITLTSIKVKVPAGAQPGRVKITTASGTSASEFMFRDTRGILFDFDGTNGLYTSNKGWHPAALVDGGVSGQCLKLDGSAEKFTCDGGDWHDGPCHFEYWAGNWQDPETYGTWDGRRLIDIVDFTNFAQMVLKFEVKINPEDEWKGCPMQIIFSGVQHVSNGNAGVKDIYGVTLPGCNNTYFNDKSISLPRYMWRPWAATGSYHTNGEWVTISAPISDFIYFMDGSVAAGNLTPDCFSNLEFFFAGGTSSEGEPSNPVLYIDNIRAVPAR